jgi:hypothetical protein
LFKGANETGRAAPTTSSPISKTSQATMSNTSQATMRNTSTQQQELVMPCTSAQAVERDRRHERKTSAAPSVESAVRGRPDIAARIREKQTYADEKRQHVERLRNMDQALMSHENTAASLEDSRAVHPGDQHHNHKGVRIIKNSLSI